MEKAQPQKEPLLIFEDGAWRGETTTHRVVLTDKALQREVTLYLKQQGVTEPSSQERSQALRTLRQISYWPAHYDLTQSDVHVWGKSREINDAVWR